jgi:phage terminase Nu1 subunit (DNA packaging protein)
VLIDLASDATQAVVADIVGVTQQNISSLQSEGKLPAFGSIGQMVQAYCQRLRDQAAGRLGAEVGGLDLVQERAALAREQRMGIEIKNAVARGEYAPITLLSEVLATASQSVVERFEQLPSQLKKNCPDLPDAAREQVMTLIADARNEWVRATSALVLAKSTESDDETEVIDA